MDIVVELNEQPLVFNPTKDFNRARQEAEYGALNTFGSWCVTIRYGCYLACTVKYAKERDYAIVCSTVY